MPRRSAAPRFLVVLALAGLLAPAVRAQDATPAPLAVTYGQLLREYAAYRPIPPAPADTTDNPDAGIRRLEIDGLVVDQTLTKLGRDFYDAFYRAWSPPAGAFNFTITVQEQPLPNVGTSVTLLVNDEVTYQARLQPREEVILGAAQQAVALAFRRLQNAGGVAPAY